MKKYFSVIFKCLYVHADKKKIDDFLKNTYLRIIAKECLYSEIPKVK